MAIKENRQTVGQLLGHVTGVNKNRLVTVIENGRCDMNKYYGKGIIQEPTQCGYTSKAVVRVGDELFRMCDNCFKQFTEELAKVPKGKVKTSKDALKKEVKK